MDQSNVPYKRFDDGVPAVHNPQNAPPSYSTANPAEIHLNQYPPNQQQAHPGQLNQQQAHPGQLNQQQAHPGQPYPGVPQGQQQQGYASYPAQPGYGQQQYAPQGGTAVANTTVIVGQQTYQPRKKPTGLDWSVFGLSIVSCLFCWPTGWIAILLSAIGVGIFQENPRSGRALTWSALAFVILSLVLMIVLVIYVLMPLFMVTSSLQSSFGDLNKEFNNDANTIDADTDWFKKGFGNSN